MANTLFWNHDRFTRYHELSIIQPDGQTTYACSMTADLDRVAEEILNAIRSGGVDEILVTSNNYAYLAPWFSVIKGELISTNYIFGEDLKYSEV